jgi:hypothetical protein
MKILSAIFISLFATSAFASYPMICRGGGISRLNTLVSLYSSATGTLMQPNIDFFFTKAAGPSGAQGEFLNPGECSWLDRAINNTEPSAINDQYLTGQSVNFSSQTSATGTKVIDVGSIYSPLTNTDGARFFIKLYVNGGAHSFSRDPAQPLKTFVK